MSSAFYCRGYATILSDSGASFQGLSLRESVYVNPLFKKPVLPGRPGARCCSPYSDITDIKRLPATLVVVSARSIDLDSVLLPNPGEDAYDVVRRVCNLPGWHAPARRAPGTGTVS